jgi:hypothetical protein
VLALTVASCGARTAIDGMTVREEAGSADQANAPVPVRDAGTLQDRDAAGMHDTDAAPDASPCGKNVAPGSLLWSRMFERDHFGPSPLDGVLRAPPAGLAACGAGLCLLGELDSRIRFDRDLVAQGRDDAYLAKLNTEGVPLWSKRLGGPSLTDRFTASSLAADARGNLVVAGSCQGQLVVPNGDGTERALDCSSGDWHSIAIRFDASGRSVWLREFDTSGVSPTIAVGGSGRTVVAANLGGAASNYEDRVAVIAWGEDGTELFRHWFQGDSVRLTRLALDAQASIVLVGQFRGQVRSLGRTAADGGGVLLDTASSSLCAVKLNASGDLVWSRCFDGNYVHAPQLALGSDGSVVLAGVFSDQADFAAFGQDAGPSRSRLFSLGGRDIYLAKLDRDGDFAWQQQLGNADAQSAPLGLATTPEGDILLAAATQGPIALGHLKMDADSVDSPFVAGFDADGRPSFVTRLGKFSNALGGHSLVAGTCRSFFLAADYSGDLETPDALRMGDIEGLVVIGGRY